MAVSEVRIGLRVKVFQDIEEDGEEFRKFVGLGTIVGEKPLYLVDDEGNVFAEVSTPIIKLDDGRELLGLECWWIAKEDADKVEEELFGQPILGERDGRE